MPHRALTTIPIIATHQGHETLTLSHTKPLHTIAHLFFSRVHNCSAAGANTAVGTASAIF